MDGQIYERPTVISPGYSPEPVEAGCCLTSCGGSPGGMQAGRHLTEEAQSDSEILKTAVSETTEGSSADDAGKTKTDAE